MAEVTFDQDVLEHLLNLLGFADDDLCFFLPFFESNPGAGEDVQDVSSVGLHGLNTVAFDNVPVIRGNLLSYRFNGTDEYLTIADNVLLTPIAGGVDVPFSVGCAFKLDAVNAAVKGLIGKWDLTTVNAEWLLSLTALEYPSLQVMDDSVAVSNMGREDQTAVDVNTWYIVIATYDGNAGGADAPEDGINIYRWDGGTRTWNGAVDDADIDGGGVYVDMEDTAELVFIGATNTGGAAAEFFDGEIMMPWYTRRELSAADALRVAQGMIRLMGL